MKAEDWIRQLDLQAHPEGGYFAEVYRSGESIPHHALDERYTGDRSQATSINFLITPKRFSALHRLKSDEIWNFYDGSPAEIIMIMPDGRLHTLVVGKELMEDVFLQAVVPAGCWFGSRVTSKADDAFSLVGCTVVPGFEYEDFELASRKELIELYPQHKSLILEMTYPSQV